jgi:hypothetical protein
MSDLRTEIVSKVLNSWDTPPQTAAGQTISEKIFNYVTNNPSCTSTDVVEGTSTDLGRASATLLALYQKGKIDRKKYPNPNPEGKRDNVFVYWATVDSYKEKGVHRMIGKAKKEKKVKLSVEKAVHRLRDTFEMPREMPRMKQYSNEIRPVQFDPEKFVKTLSLTEVKRLYKFLESYFE